jgi:hypothetical protein
VQLVPGKRTKEELLDLQLHRLPRCSAT